MERGFPERNGVTMQEERHTSEVGQAGHVSRVLVRKGLLTNEEVLEEIKAVRREMEGKRGR